MLWVQGCSLACPGCVVPDTHAATGGSGESVASLVSELAALDVDGITFSGGEPMQQAEALVAIADGVRAERDLSLMAYTGYTLGHLRRRGTAAQRALLARLDILVDGRFVAERQTDLRWRGSDNQRVHLLTDRHRDLVDRLTDRGVWMQVVVEDDGVFWMGIPPPGFRFDFEAALAKLGLVNAPPAPRSMTADPPRSPTRGPGRMPETNHER